MRASTVELRRYRRALEGLLGIPATDGNRVDVLRNGDEIFPAMLDAIRSARRTVDFHTFIYWAGDIGEEFARALAERSRAGVRVRVLLDAMGARSLDRELVHVIEDAGGQVAWFRPVGKAHWEATRRTHRKVMICDEHVAFTGGVGIADEWRGDARNPSEWRDTHFRVFGPAVCGLRAAFLDNWAETGRSLFDEGVDMFPEQPPAGSSVVQVIRAQSDAAWSDITTVVRSLLRLARHTVRLTTAYFSPDDTTCGLLAATARRGVSVDLLLPGPHADKRFCQLASEAQFEALLDAGVRIWAYQPSMLHAKVMTVDGLVANIGTANLNGRSLALDEEVNLAVVDPDVVGVLDDHFRHDLSRSEPIQPRQWEDRGLVQRVKEAATSLLGDHL